jgi:hypothetical protein
MLVVIPVSASDNKISPDFCAAVKNFAPYSHEVLYVARPSDVPSLADASDRLRGCFREERAHLFDVDGPRGWPVGPNFYWQQTILHLAKTGNQQPWLWLEMDCTPLRQGWLDDLDQEYRECGKPFMGMFGKSSVVGKTGKTMLLSEHLVGVAIYPPQISNYLEIHDHAEFNVAFDYLYQYEMIPQSHESRLMQHGFRTKMFHEQLGVIKCHDASNLPEGKRHDQPVKPGIALHHGCIDGSLSKLICIK